MMQCCAIAFSLLKAATGLIYLKHLTGGTITKDFWHYFNCSLGYTKFHLQKDS